MVPAYGARFVNPLRPWRGSAFLIKRSGFDEFVAACRAMVYCVPARARIQVSGSEGRFRGAGRGICGRRAVGRGLLAGGFAGQGLPTAGSRARSGRLHKQGSAWTGGLNFLSADT